MANEFRAKVFKSGNSLALRLPKALGFAEGDDMVVVQHADGAFSCWSDSEAAKVLMSLYGSMSDGFMADGRGDVVQGERRWSQGEAAAA